MNSTELSVAELGVTTAAASSLPPQALRPKLVSKVDPGFKTKI